MVDLWPDNLIDIGDLKVPSMVLKGQADLLAKKTRNILEGRVISSTDAFYGDDHRIRWHFQIFSPALDYTYELFLITHSIELYPLLFETEDVDIKKCYGDNINADDEKTLIEIMGKLFSTKRTLRIIKSLIAQSLSQNTREKVTEPDPSFDSESDIPF